MKDPECMFVFQALALDEGETDVNMMLIKNADGSYRKANGKDLAILGDKAPNFIKRTRSYYREV